MLGGRKTSSDRLVAIWHIGARDGYMPIAFPASLDAGVDVLLIDAAEESCPPRLELADGRIPEICPQRLVACVAGSTACRRFEVRVCPHASGLFPFSSEFAEWSVFGNGQCDYVLGVAHATERSEDCHPVTVDQLCGEMGSQRPSMLIVDAQGASSEILLQGARGVLSDLDAIVAEVELMPFYGEPASFADLLPGLWRHGFAFSGFLEEAESWATPACVPVGQRCAPLPGSKDAVFLRVPQRFNWDGSFARLSRYVTCCTILGHVDFGLAVLLRTDADSVGSASSVFPFQSFTVDLWHAQRKMPRVFPPRWRPPSDRGPSVGAPTIAELTELADMCPTPVETVLRAYGFESTMHELQARRLVQARLLLNCRDD